MYASVLKSRIAAVQKAPLKKALRAFLRPAMMIVLVAVSANTAIAAVTVSTYTVTGAWTAPEGVFFATVAVWGGGGGGGGQALASDGGGGGGGGAYSLKYIAVTPSGNYTVTVGSAGAAGSGGCGKGGGPSWFNTNATVLAQGGLGGCNSTGTPPDGALGGATGSGIGDTKYSGGQGGAGKNNNTGLGGPGGSSAGPAAAGWSGPNPSASYVSVTAGAAPAGGGIGGDGGANGVVGSPGTAPGGGGGGSGEGNPIAGGAGAASPYEVLVPPAPSPFRSLPDFRAGSSSATLYTSFRIAAGASKQCQIAAVMSSVVNAL